MGGMGRVWVYNFDKSKLSFIDVVDTIIQNGNFHRYVSTTKLF